MSQSRFQPPKQGRPDALQSGGTRAVQPPTPPQADAKGAKPDQAAKGTQPKS